MRQQSSIPRIFAFSLICAFLPAAAQVITYPTPPGLTTSPDFTVTANGAPIWVHKNGGDGTVSVTGALAMMNAASFACSGPVIIAVTASSNITSYIIRPKSRGITAQVSGRTLTFTIPSPQYLYLEINNLAHLAIFADPPEVNPPHQGDAGVTYYGPGTSTGNITLQSNQTYYLAPGSVVVGNVSGSNVQNVKILGRGILQGTVRISNSSNLEINGIMVQHWSSNWTNTLTNCSNMTYRHVKVWSWPENSVDGINPVSCNHFTIDSCFIRACDDCISIKSRTAPSFNITVTNNVMVGWAWSDGVNTLESTPTSAPCDSILVKNCDILYSRGGSPSGHAAINWSVDGAATIQNIRVEDVRCEEKCENDLQVQVTNGAVWAGSTPGHLKGVYFKNITWENTAGSFKLIGYSANNLAEDITFDNCYVGNKLLTSTSDAAFQVNQYVKNVRFINSGTGARPSSESTARPVLRVTTKKNSGLLSVAINRPGIHAVSISSLSGRDLKCFKGAGENEFAIKTGEFGAGIYVIHSEIDGKCASQLLINR